MYNEYQWCWECTMIGGYCGNSCCRRNYPMIGRTFLDTQNASEIDPLYALADELVVLKRHTLNLVANVSPDHDEYTPVPWYQVKEIMQARQNA